MIVTVKAWLHAEVNWKGELEYKLHSFETPLGPRSTVLREMSFDVIVEEPAAAEARKSGLMAELEYTNQRARQIKEQLGEVQ